MPVASNIVLADAQATPVNHTFIPMGKDQNGVYWFEDQSQSNPLGYWRLAITVTRPLPGAAGAKSSIDRVSRVKVATHIPELETTGTADSGLPALPTIAFIERASTEYILPERGGKLPRQNIRKIHNGALAHALVQACVEDLQTVTG